MMDKLFQHSGWLKLFSLALAILLWAMVIPTYMTETTRTFDVPLTIKPHPSFELLDGPREGTVIQVRADGKNLVLSRLRREQFDAVLDYSKVQEPGKPTALEVQVDGPERTGLQYSASPSQYTVTLIENGTRRFPVRLEPDSSGVVVQDGREYVYTARPMEQSVSFTGRSDILSQVRVGKIALEPGDLQPGSEAVVKSVLPVDASGQPVEKLDRSVMTVQLTWEELPPGKPFRIEPVTEGTVPDGYQVTSIEVEPRTVSVRAVTVDGTLPEREIVETAPIDLNGRTSSFSVTVRLVPPGETTLGVQTVNVRVHISEVLVEQVFKQLPIELRNQAEGVDVILSQSDATVRVKGPYSIMTRIDASSVNLYVDVAGRTDGRHTLPVRLLSWPSGVTEVDIDPALVEVVISAP